MVEVDFKGPGADGQPTGAPVKTYDYTPHAGGADFDDSEWEVIEPSSLSKRRATGRICFNWYRINITVPDRVAGLDPTGSTVVFETSLDDYPEVWVDGEIARHLGQRGGSVVGGWNAANRLVVGRVGYHFVGFWEALLAVSFALTLKWWRNVRAPSRSKEIPVKPVAATLTIRLPLVWLSLAVFFISIPESKHRLAPGATAY
jgi:hypothetical protein